MKESAAEPLGSYLGRQLRGIRDEQGLRQKDIEARLHDLGITWTRSTVAAFEIGRRVVTLEEALLCCAAYDVTLAQLMQKEPQTWVQVGPLRISAHTVGTIVAGGAAPALSPQLEPNALATLGPTEAERRAARRVGVSVAHMVVASEGLWGGRRLEAERDRRVEIADSAGADPATLRALRGHVTRELLAELKSALQEGGN